MSTYIQPQQIPSAMPAEQQIIPAGPKPVEHQDVIAVQSQSLQQQLQTQVVSHINLSPMKAQQEVVPVNQGLSQAQLKTVVIQNIQHQAPMQLSAMNVSPIKEEQVVQYHVQLQPPPTKVINIQLNLQAVSSPSVRKEQPPWDCEPS